MMRDPMDVMRKLYAWAGDELTADVEARDAAAGSTDTHRTCSRLNNYTLDQYGLSVEHLEPIFAEYLTTFDIELGGQVLMQGVDGDRARAGRGRRGARSHCRDRATS